MNFNNNNNDNNNNEIHLASWVNSIRSGTRPPSGAAANQAVANNAVPPLRFQGFRAIYCANKMIWDDTRLNDQEKRNAVIHKNRIFKEALDALESNNEAPMRAFIVDNDNPHIFALEDHPIR